MRRTKTRMLVGLLAVFAMAVGVCSAMAQAQRVRARIGIQVATDGGQSSSALKTGETLRKGDLLRIYIKPEDRLFVYVIHSDNTTATLLNPDTAPVEGTTVALPGEGKYYQVDGLSDTEAFTIICSPLPLEALAFFDATGKVPHQQWEPVARSLEARGKIVLTQQAEKPMVIAGNVRSFTVGEQLPVFSGNGLVVKRYALGVEK